MEELVLEVEFMPVVASLVGAALAGIDLDDCKLTNGRRLTRG